MSRPLRIQYPGAWYHVLNRGRNREKIFMSDDDYIGFLNILGEATDLWEVNIAAFCLMPNHYHLLLQTPLANLSRCMRHVNGVYTQQVNRRHGHDGQVFRGRYKSILVNAEAYLLQLVRYIHRNPLTSGLTSSLGDYWWSSHLDYVSRIPRWRWLHRDFVLSQFGGRRSVSVSSYQRFVSNSDSNEVEEFYSQARLSPVMGSDEFIQDVQSRVAHRLGHPEIPDSARLRPSAEKVIDGVCKEYGVSEAIICTPRPGENNEARSIAIYLIRVLCGEKLMDIGKRFGLSRHSSVSTHIRMIKGRAGADKELKRKLESIASNVRGTSNADLTPNGR